MERYILKRAGRTACLFALGAGLALPAWCGSSIVNVFGQVQFVGTPDSLVPGADESDSWAIAFLEQSNLALASNLAVDVTQAGLYDSAVGLTPGVIAAGTVVSDTYFHSDPVANSGTRFIGSITFSTDILGVISKSSTLNATDSLLGDSGVTYAGTDLGRGFELNPASDEFTISQDLKTLTFSVMTWANVDDLRIITQGTTGALGLNLSTDSLGTPEPGTFLLIGASFMALGFVCRKPRHK